MCERYECFGSAIEVGNKNFRKGAALKNVGVQNLEPLHFFRQPLFYAGEQMNQERNVILV